MKVSLVMNRDSGVLAVLYSVQCVRYVVIIHIHWPPQVLFPDRTENVCVGVCVWWYSHVFMCVHTPVHADVGTYVYACMCRPEFNIRCLQKFFFHLIFWVTVSLDLELRGFTFLYCPRAVITDLHHWTKIFHMGAGEFQPRVANSLPTQPYLENSKILRTKFNSSIRVPMALIFS